MPRNLLSFLLQPAPEWLLQILAVRFSSHLGLNSTLGAIYDIKDLVRIDFLTRLHHVR